MTEQTNKLWTLMKLTPSVLQVTNKQTNKQMQQNVSKTNLVSYELTFFFFNLQDRTTDEMHIHALWWKPEKEKGKPHTYNHIMH